MKKITITTMLFAGFVAFGQVGVNTVAPKATFDINAKNVTGTDKSAEGLLIPRVDRQRAQSMEGVENSTLIYVNNILTGSALDTAVNIDTVGYYYFDNNVWNKLSAGDFRDTSIYNQNGTIGENRTVNQGSNSLTFNTEAVNGFSISKPGVPSILSIDGENTRVGIGISSPSAKLHVEGDMRITQMQEGNVISDKVMTVNTSGDVKKVDPKVFFNDIDQTINFKGVTTNYAMVGDEDVIWFGGGSLLTFPYPTDAQIRRGRVTHIIAAGNAVNFSGTFPLVKNATSIRSLPFGARISIVPVNAFGGRGWYVVSASTVY